VTTLTYVYADQTAVLGPLATYAEPHAYDLCDQHSERLSAPRGWEVLRLANDIGSRGPSQDDLLAIADAVRETGRPADVEGTVRPRVANDGPDQVHNYRTEPGREVGRRGHLRVLTSDDDGE
jgi:Protein of unknown function (DUF3499)